MEEKSCATSVHGWGPPRSARSGWLEKERVSTLKRFGAAREEAAVLNTVVQLSQPQTDAGEDLPKAVHRSVEVRQGRRRAEAAEDEGAVEAVVRRRVGPFMDRSLWRKVWRGEHDRQKVRTEEGRGHHMIHVGEAWRACVLVAEEHPFRWRMRAEQGAARGFAFLILTNKVDAGVAAALEVCTSIEAHVL